MNIIIMKYPILVLYVELIKKMKHSAWWDIIPESLIGRKKEEKKTEDGIGYDNKGYY